MRHIGFLVVSNSTFKDFHYPLMWDDEHDVHAVNLPGRGTANVSLTNARKGDARLELNAELDEETKAVIQKLWGETG